MITTIIKMHVLVGNMTIQITVAIFFTPCVPPTPVMQSIKQDTYYSSQSFDQYLLHFVDCSEPVNWDYRTRVLVLSASLRGTAQTYYMSLTESERRDYFTLVSKLRNQFGHLKHQALWLNKLESRKRQRSENIAS